MRKGQRLTGMSASQASFPIVPSKFKFAQYGESGAWVSELLPYTAKIADRLTFIKSLYTEAINHDPAVTLHADRMRRSPGGRAWARGSSTASAGDGGSAGIRGDDLARLRHGRSASLRPAVGQRFLAQQVSGCEVPLGRRSGAVSLQSRRLRSRRTGVLSSIRWAKLNQYGLDEFGDPEIATRIAQYEMAFRMQTSVPELTDLSKEPPARSNCTEPTRASPEPSPPTACWRAGWPSAACASFSSIIATGTITASCRKTCRSAARRPTRPPRRWSRI